MAVNAICICRDFGYTWHYYLPDAITVGLITPLVSQHVEIQGVSQARQIRIGRCICSKRLNATT